LIRQEDSDVAFPSISAKGAEQDGTPCILFSLLLTIICKDC